MSELLAALAAWAWTIAGGVLVAVAILFVLMLCGVFDNPNINE